MERHSQLPTDNSWINIVLFSAEKKNLHKIPYSHTKNKYKLSITKYMHVIIYLYIINTIDILKSIITVRLYTNTHYLTCLSFEINNLSITIKYIT